ncbi:MAG: FAD-dependent oxidoreductase [Thermodesulfobacteriota bacterium]|nr:FAD-dependent oxidoreductase [Thermodesulfobacteriota bacterium]
MSDSKSDMSSITSTVDSVKHLFTAFRFKGLTLKNRIVLPALASFLLDDDGAVTEKAVNHYRLRAAGGPAMVITEACAVSREGIVSPNQARISHDRFIEGLSKIARAVKAEGAIPAIQIHHAGRQTSVKIIKQKPYAPSPLRCPAIRGDVDPLTSEGIQVLVKKFGDAAVRAMEAGFELLEIHGAHGYLINQFISGFSNIREDEYGGSTVGRTRFAREVVREIRSRLGDGFPLSFKISAQEFVPGGLTVEESVQVLKILADAGIDIVQVSAGNDATPEWICQPAFMKKGCLVDSAEKIRKELDIPVMVVGRINDPLMANKIIQTGKADLVCMGRGLMADPKMPKKAIQGRFDDIRTCIACNTCMESIFRKGRVECLVNPALGREREMEIRPAETPKKVMVIGGGPGGLNIAWVAARRGHDVQLFERQPQLGGQLKIGSVSNFKKELLNLIRFQKRQVKRFKVKCHLNHEVTIETIKQVNPEVVVLATGSIPLVPSVEGIENEIVVPIHAVLNRDRPLCKKTIIIGGGAAGCEIALHLSECGSLVTMVEILPKIGGDLETMTKKILVQKLKEHNVQIKTESKLSRIENNGVVITDQNQKETFIETQRVVIAIGYRSDNRLYDQIRSLGYETHRIGDCLEARSAKEAIYEGMALGCSI